MNAESPNNPESRAAALRAVIMTPPLLKDGAMLSSTCGPLTAIDEARTTSEDSTQGPQFLAQAQETLQVTKVRPAPTSCQQCRYHKDYMSLLTSAVRCNYPEVRVRQVEALQFFLHGNAVMPVRAANQCPHFDAPPPALQDGRPAQVVSANYAKVVCVLYRDDILPAFANTPVADLEFQHFKTSLIMFHRAEQVVFKDTDGTERVLKSRF